MTGIPQHDDDRYLKGVENTVLRYYFYLMKGLDIVNSFRNLFLGIIAIYIALKLENPLWAVGMFVLGSILITLAGWYNVHRVAKQHEWIGMRFSTHFGIKNFDYVKDSNELLREIRDLLRNQNVR